MNLIHRFLARFKKQSKTPSSPCTDSVISREIASVTQLNEEQQLELALKVKAQMKSENIHPNKQNEYVAASVAALAAAALIPLNAEASICGRIQRQFESQIASRLKRPFEDAVYDALDSATAIFDEITEFGSSMAGTAKLDATDAENHVTHTIQNNRIQRAMEPAPLQCESDASVQEVIAATAKSEVTAVNMGIEMQRSSMPLDIHEPARRMEAISQSPERLKASLSLSSILSTNDERNTNELKGGMDFIVNVVGTDPSSESLQSLRASHSRGLRRGRRLELRQSEGVISTKRARASIASCTLAKVKASNDPEGSTTKLRREALRTYGSSAEGWRSEIRSYADPNPLAIELCLQMAFQNKVMLEILEQRKQLNVQAGATLLEYMDQARGIG